MRPQLALLGCGLAGGNPEKALPAAVAVELLHNFTLIHDDIMDEADSRRGKPTVHTKWDQNKAILSGDVMFGMAYEQLESYSSEKGYDVNVLPALLKTFNKAVKIVCEGQAIDMDFETTLSVTLDDYLLMIKCKTAALLESSLKMGGIVSGASEEKLNQLGIIGLEAGIAFQIQDDLLDATGDPEKFGKRVGGDIYEGKKTWLTISLLQRASADDKKRVESILQNSECTETDVSFVIEMFYKYDVISDTKEAIKNHYIASLHALSHFDNSPYKDAVNALLNKLTDREF